MYFVVVVDDDVGVVLFWVQEMSKSFMINELEIYNVLLHSLCYISAKSYYVITEKDYVGC